MLSAEKNEMLVRVSAGTPMGELIRRFWVPALLEEEVPVPDGDPVEVRLLGENLVAFRDTEGRIGLVDAHCPHRGAPLLFGRNEECGLRCVYHGWKFDVDGQCVDQPNEPPTSRFKERVRVTSYPTTVAGGVVWAYMGPQEVMPEGPSHLEWTQLPPGHVVVSKRWQESNWAQAVEGGVDTTHVGFLHREWDPDDGGYRPMMAAAYDDAEQVQGMELIVGDPAPRIFVHPSDFGFWLGCRGKTPDDDVYYWRITPFMMPFYKVVPPFMPTEVDQEPPPFDGHAWVPIDDENTWTYNVVWRSDRPFTDEEIAAMKTEMGVHAPTGPGYRPLANKENMYFLDRELQRTSSFSGMKNPNVQDRAMQEMMGPILDRTKERLGKADLAIIAFRRIMLQAAEALEEGKEPTAPQWPEVFKVRAASALLDEETEFVAAAEAWLRR